MFDNSLLVAFVLSVASLLVSASAPAPITSCANIQTAPIPCCVPTQLLFIFDYSESLNQAAFDNAVDFVKRSRCLFENGRVQTGMLTFNQDVKTVIPMQSYTSDEFIARMDNFSSSYQPSAFTPMAEAFEYATKMFQDASATVAEGCTTVNKVAIVLTDGYPAQSGGAGSFSTYSSTGLPMWKYNAGTPITHSKYVVNQTPQSANKLKALGVTVVMVALPGDTFGAKPHVDYFKGVIDPAKKCNNFGLCGSWTTAQKSLSQCYLKRVPSTGAFTTPYTCNLVVPTDYPIASSTAHILSPDAPSDLILQTIVDMNPLTCPVQSCFNI